MKRNIEAFARYHQTKESLAEYTQIGSAAIQLLSLNVSVHNGPSLLGQFVDACGSNHWSPGKNFPDPVRKTQQIGEMLCQHVLVQQISAFDLFTRAVVSDFSRFSSWARSNCEEIAHTHSLLILSPQGRWVSSPCCNEQQDKLGDLINRLTDLGRLIHWKPSEKLSSIEPLFHLVRMCRNSIVHSDGLIGSELSEFSTSEKVTKALKAFRSHYTKSDIPPLPEWARGSLLHITPENAILFGAILYEFAREINTYACSKLTDDDFIEMAFFYSCVVETHSFRTIKHRDAEARIKHFLASRYVYKDASKFKNIHTPLKNKITAKFDKDTIETTNWKIALARHEALRAIETAIAPTTSTNTASQASDSSPKKKANTRSKKIAK